MPDATPCAPTIEWHNHEVSGIAERATIRHEDKRTGALACIDLVLTRHGPDGATLRIYADDDWLDRATIAALREALDAFSELVS